jgi:hypothetical protein
MIPDDPVLVKYKFQRAIVVNQTNYVKLQIGMLINGLNRTRILIALVLVLLLGQSKTSYYKVLLYEHTIYSYHQNIH